jgi:hypothetical protein
MITTPRQATNLSAEGKAVLVLLPLKFLPDPRVILTPMNSVLL